MPSNTPSPYSRPWSHTETTALPRSCHVPSIHTMEGIGGISLLWSPVTTGGEDAVRRLGIEPRTYGLKARPCRGIEVTSILSRAQSPAFTDSICPPIAPDSPDV